VTTPAAGTVVALAAGVEIVERLEPFDFGEWWLQCLKGQRACFLHPFVLHHPTMFRNKLEQEELKAKNCPLHQSDNA
jgi:hypothetical protein